MSGIMDKPNTIFSGDKKKSKIGGQKPFGGHLKFYPFPPPPGV